MAADAAEELAVRNVFTEILADASANDVAEPRVVVLDALHSRSLRPPSMA
jgi:hypothetical protein